MEANPGNSQILLCKLCSKKMHGGVYRLKNHIAGISRNVSKCLKATKENREKCYNDLNSAKKKKA